MFNALSDFWTFSTCVEQPGFVVPKYWYSPNQNGWLFSSQFACYNYVDGTEERIAIDRRCSPEQRTTFLQGLEDAKLLATNALQWPHSGYGVDAMDMWMGKGAHGNATIVEYTQGALNRISLNTNFPDSPKFLALDCEEHWYPDDACNMTVSVEEDAPATVICYAFGHDNLAYTTSENPRHNKYAAVDFIRCCPAIFETKPDIVEIDRRIARTKLADPPGIDFLTTAGETLLHELMHTRLITNNHSLIDVEVEDWTMYGATSCSHLAEKCGLPFSSLNADSYALAIAAMSWKDRFESMLPPVFGRPPIEWWPVPEPPLPPFFVEESDLDLEQATFSQTQIQKQSEESALHTWFEPRRLPPPPTPDFDPGALRMIQILSVVPTLLGAAFWQSIFVLLLVYGHGLWTRVLLPALREDMARREAARAALYDETVG